MNTSIRHGLLHQIAAFLLLATLGIRALVPVGYMPGNLLDGKFAELCPVASAATYALLPAHDNHHHDHQSGGQDDAAYSMDSACPIGSSLFSDALPMADQMVEPAIRPQTFERPLFFRPHSAKQHRNYPARAPPVS